MSVGVDSTAGSYDDSATETLDTSERDRRRRAAAILGTLLILIIAWWILTRFAAVPNVIGMSEQHAIDTIEEAGFVVGDVTEVAAEDVEIDTVADQSPEAGTRHLRGSEIAVTIARDGVESDDESGSSSQGTYDESLASTDTAGSSEDAGDRHDGGGGGTASDTRPRMLSVLGMTEEAARATLQQAGLVFTVDYGPTTASQPGTVFYQNPAPGAFYDTGASLSIWVSTGAPEEGFPYPQPGTSNP